MDNYLNAIKRHAANMDAQLPQPRFATVTSYNPADHTCKVQIEPEEILTGWIPIATGMTGNGFGVVIPPLIGQQVFVVPQDGDHRSYVVVGSVFSQINLPPKPANAIAGSGVAIMPGEIGLVSQDGNVVIRLTGDGQLYIKGGTAVNVETQTANITSPTINVTATAAFNVTSPTSTFTGNVLVTGDISDANGSKGTLGGLRTNYDQHAHAGVTNGTGTTQTTNRPIGD